jgi:hypothetical protein
MCPQSVKLSVCCVHSVPHMHMLATLLPSRFFPPLQSSPSCRPLPSSCMPPPPPSWLVYSSISKASPSTHTVGGLAKAHICWQAGPQTANRESRPQQPPVSDPLPPCLPGPCRNIHLAQEAHCCSVTASWTSGAQLYTSRPDLVIYSSPATTDGDMSTAHAVDANIHPATESRSQVHLYTSNLSSNNPTALLFTSATVPSNLALKECSAVHHIT